MSFFNKSKQVIITTLQLNSIKRLLLPVVACLFVSGCDKLDVLLQLDEEARGSLTVEFSKLYDNSFYTYGEVPEYIKILGANISISPIKENGGKRHRLIYSFEDLAEALPVIERLLPVAPRFIEESGEFVVSLKREKTIWERNIDQILDTHPLASVNFSVRFPSAPIAEGGTVEGSTAKWSWNREAINKIVKSPIGTLIGRASISSDSIGYDPSHSKFIINSHYDVKKAFLSNNIAAQKGGVLFFDSRIPITSSWLDEYKWNAKLQYAFPLESLEPPFSYHNLIIDRMIINGKPVKCRLISPGHGILSGTDSWGRKREYFDVTLSFSAVDAWLTKIDSLQMSMNVTLPLKKRLVKLAVNEKGGSIQPFNWDEKKLGKLAVVEFALGGVKQKVSESFVKLRTAVSPQLIDSVLLRTPYGLSYAPKKMHWGKADDEDGVRDLKMSFEYLPPPPFVVEVSYIDKADSKRINFKQEMIDVLP